MLHQDGILRAQSSGQKSCKYPGLRSLTLSNIVTAKPKLCASQCCTDHIDTIAPTTLFQHPDTQWRLIPRGSGFLYICSKHTSSYDRGTSFRCHYGRVQNQQFRHFVVAFSTTALRMCERPPSTLPGSGAELECRICQLPQHLTGHSKSCKPKPA